MALAHLLNQTITIANPGARDRQGKPSFGAGTQYQARVEKVHKSIVTRESEITPIDAEVFVETSDIILIGAKVIYSGSSYRALSVEEVVGGNGRRHHLEIMAQLWNV